MMAAQPDSAQPDSTPAPLPASLPAGAPLRLRRPRITHERLLALLLIAEIIVFTIAGHRFFTLDNAAEIVRAGAETALLALALTPVILTGGIDLSVGSLLGLCAIVLGVAWRDAGLPIAFAGAAAIATGACGGLLNAWLVARLRLPPLIVTLGTYSLFRGLAEGLTAGVRSYSNLPPAFLAIGQGAIAGLPAQLFVLMPAAIAFGLLVHRLAIGRVLRAIGFAPEGARHAGLAVDRTIALVYLLSGITAGVAALLYVARLGQAKADAGTGFELTAITAVVLGGTSIFGGRGSIGGTLLGLALLAVLQNGLRLADLPAELAGIATAALLVLALGAHRIFGERAVS